MGTHFPASMKSLYFRKANRKVLSNTLGDRFLIQILMKKHTYVLEYYI